MPVETDPRTFYHEIDADGIIRKVNQEWLDFAYENDAGHLSAQSVIGSSLWDHISDSETVRIYQIMICKGHETGRSISLPFRCDSPELKREMIMTIEPLGDGGTAFHSRVLRMESRKRAAFLDINAPRSDLSLLICSWCRKVKMTEENWLEVEDAVNEMRLMEEPHPPQLIECVCPSCYESLIRKIQVEAANQ